VELRHLRYFVAVAEMENVSRAATQRLHIAQPSLSRQIRDLEDEVGVQLLERTAKSVRLTDAGRAFLEEARAILKHADEAVNKARAVAGKQELPVGDWPLGTGRIMPQLLRAYQQAMPNVHVKPGSSRLDYTTRRKRHLVTNRITIFAQAAQATDIEQAKLRHLPLCLFRDEAPPLLEIEA
jgi:DNA-binding transcriptional LysR family regulator